MKKKNLKTNDSSNEINEPILTKSQKNERWFFILKIIGTFWLIAIPIIIVSIIV